MESLMLVSDAGREFHSLQVLGKYDCAHVTVLQWGTDILLGDYGDWK